MTDLRVLAEECSFGTLTNRLIRDKLVFVTKGRVQARLLREVDLTLDRAVAICHAYKTAERCGKEFEKQKNVDKVKVKSTKSPSHYSKPPNKQGSSTSTSGPMLKYDCKFCGRKHLATKESCPAYRNCRQENHLSKFCPKKHSKVQTLNRREDDYDDSESTQDEAWLGAVQNTGLSTIRAKMLVNDCEVNFEIDSGAEVNIIQQKYVLKSMEASLSVTNPKKLPKLTLSSSRTSSIIFSELMPCNI